MAEGRGGFPFLTSISPELQRTSSLALAPHRPLYQTTINLINMKTPALRKNGPLPPLPYDDVAVSKAVYVNALRGQDSRIKVSSE